MKEIDWVLKIVIGEDWEDEITYPEYIKIKERLTTALNNIKYIEKPILNIIDSDKLKEYCKEHFINSDTLPRFACYQILKDNGYNNSQISRIYEKDRASIIYGLREYQSYIKYYENEFSSKLRKFVEEYNKP